jgi:ABC-2 type transport system permease protein
MSEHATRSLEGAPPKPPGLPAPRRSVLSALGALFGLALRQQARGRRLLIMSFLFLLPVILTVVIRSIVEYESPRHGLEHAMLLFLLPGVLLPLAALLHASGVIQDELEEQTLTYLLVRPLPRPWLYLAKLLASWLLVAGIGSVFTMLLALAIYWGEPDFVQAVFQKGAQLVVIHWLTLATYSSIFALVSLYTRRTLIVGIAYIILFEIILGNIEFVIRQVTVIFYYRVLVLRWVGFEAEEWNIDLLGAPSTATCFYTLVGVTVLAAVLGARVFSGKEFHVKTPEGS